MATKTRRRERLCESPYVRYTDGRFQARIWLGGPWKSISLGLYRSEEAAAAAARAVLRLLPGDHTLDPLTAWRATRKAIQMGVVRTRVLPKFVIRKGGEFFARTGVRFADLIGPFATPVAACCAAIDHRLQDVNGRRARG